MRCLPAFCHPMLLKGVNILKQINKETRNTRGTPEMMWRFLRGSKRYFAIGILSAVGVSLFELLNPQIICMTVDSVIGSEPMNLPAFLSEMLGRYADPNYLRNHLWWIAIAIVAVSLLSVAFRYLFRVSNAKGAETLVQSMRDQLYAHIARLPFSWHMKNQTGDIIQRCTSDVDTVKRFLSEQLTSILRIVILIALSLTFMFRMNAGLAAIATLFVPVVLAFSFFFHRRIGSRFQTCDESEGKLSAIVQENLTGVRVVRAFGRERYEEEKFNTQNEQYANLWTHLVRLMSAFWASSDLISGLQIMTIIVCGTVECVHGHMTSGEFIAFLSYNTMLTWPVRQLGRMVSELSKAGISVRRISEIMGTAPESDSVDAFCPSLKGDIRFDHVSFAYDDCPELLHDVSFTIKAGTTFGILGSTGSGKSTLMYLLTRLYDLPANSGTITIGEVPVDRIQRTHLRRGIGMVMQEPYLFSRTIAENIAITADQTNLNAVRDASRTACLDETVTGFEQGYETFVGERGVTLSGGQKQRVAIARMLTQKTPIMIFDDSLSAVDAETDAKIRAALREKMVGTTVILIAHRITTLMQADQIIVLDRGRIVERGNHEELLRQNGIYRKIYEIQMNPNALDGEVTA